MPAFLPAVQVLAGFQNVDQNTSDGTFETGVTGWFVSGGTFAQSSVQAHTGTFSGLMTVTGTPTQCFARNGQTTVTAGGRYDATMWVFSDLASVQATIDWATSAGVFISSSTTSYTVSVHVWTPITVTGVAPGTAGLASAGPTLPSSPATGSKLYVDDFLGPITGPGAFLDISASVRTVTTTRPVTRVQGPLWEYQAGTASITLKNGDGRFDPDNLTGPYVSAATLEAVTLSSELTSWTAPANLFGASLDARCAAAGGWNSAGASNGGGGGEYAEEPFLPVVAGQVFTTQTGNGGNGFLPNTIFGTITAHGGGVATGGTGGNGGTGSAAAIHFDGAAGGTTSGSAGGGGGSSAGPNQQGNRGTAGFAPTQDPAAGGLPVSGGGGGGTGGDATLTATPGLFPGGGAGGPGNNTFDTGQSGGNGYIQVLYRAATGTNVSQVGPGVDIQVNATWPFNFLGLIQSGSTDNDDFEGTLGTWVSSLNATLTDTAAQAHSGANSMQMSSNASGNMAAASTVATAIASQGMPCIAGQVITASAWFRSAVSARSCNIGCDFYNPAGGIITTAFGPNITDSTSAWTQATDGGAIIAPAGAVKCRATVRVQATGVTVPEIHYVDDVILMPSPLVTYNLFTGTADAWTDTGLNNPNYAETVLTATDGFEGLSIIQLPAAPSNTGILEDSGARITRILNAAGWPAAARAITTGDSIQQGESFGSDALSLLQLTAATEAGELYINGAGNVVFRHRQAILEDTRSSTPQGVFGDQPGTSHTAGTELAGLGALGRAIDNTTIANDIQITAVAYVFDLSPALQEAQDLPSQSVNGVRTYSRTDLLLVSDPIAYQYAAWVLALSKNPEDRFDTLTVNPRRDPVRLYPQALGREVGDRIETWRTPPGVSRFSKDSFIRGIQHVFDASSQTWATTWTLQNTARYDQVLILDSATKGLIDVDMIGY